MRNLLPSVLILFLLSGCGTTRNVPETQPAARARHAEPIRHGRITAATFQNERDASPTGREVVLYSLMLKDIKYLFGGKNPSLGLDCSGFVVYVFQQAAGMPLKGNAASLARQGREIPVDQLRGGDLVFFNTLGRPFSHVGVYIGRGEFAHSPNSRSRVRVDKMTSSYWSKRFEMARSLLD